MSIVPKRQSAEPSSTKMFSFLQKIVAIIAELIIDRALNGETSITGANIYAAKFINPATITIYELLLKLIVNHFIT